MPRNKRSLHKIIKRVKNNKTRRQRLRGGQLEVTKSPERELYDSYVNKFVDKYLPLNEREKFPNLSNSFKDYKIELLMAAKDPLFKSKSLSEKTESIKNVLNKKSSVSSSPISTSTSTTVKSKPKPQSLFVDDYSSQRQVMHVHEVNTGLALAEDFDMCTIL